MKRKIRLDEYLYKNGLSESFDKAKKEIIAGWVKVNGETVRKPGRIITGQEGIQLSNPAGDFISRGGYKLEHALRHFKISVKDKVIADIGASTGGFTDCLLKNGASKVYSIDVGYGILAYSLRIDPRVIVKERINVRNLAKADFDDNIDFITVDLSFISILKIIETLKRLFSPVSGIILLKPQFEAEPGEHQKGIVTEREYHINILNRILGSLNKSCVIFRGLHFSPVKGPAGNIEFLLYFELVDDMSDVRNKPDISIINVVNEAHNKLN